MGARLGITWIMLSSYTEASPMPAPVASLRPIKTCVCQENGGLICDKILCAFTPPVITDTFAPTPTRVVILRYQWYFLVNVDQHCGPEEHTLLQGIINILPNG
ncbi:hypothetical protein B0H14DRAFT_2585537 [Mycena olivaceomarginata]|nr:hypothetical protein B0H14DRAFT_2585537 [Mycena olivaceomarginata]